MTILHGISKFNFIFDHFAQLFEALSAQITILNHVQALYIKSFFEAKTLTGSNFQNTDSFILCFEYVIEMINKITGMYFI